RKGLALEHAKVLGGVIAAYLQHDDLEAGLGQDLGGDAAAGAGADDDNVGAQRLVCLKLVAVQNLCVLRFRHVSSPHGTGSSCEPWRSKLTQYPPHAILGGPP